MAEIAEMRIDVEFELGGMLFARVRASFIDGTRLVGAHVDLDGNVLGDTGLRETRLEGSVDGEVNGAIRALRQSAATAVMSAHRECGMTYTRADSVRTLEILARALPFPVSYLVTVTRLVGAGEEETRSEIVTAEVFDSPKFQSQLEQARNSARVTVEHI